jgi:hypothetical protein
LVECQLPKLDVAGSSPVARSQENALIITDWGVFFYQLVRLPCLWCARCVFYA